VVYKGFISQAQTPYQKILFETESYSMLQNHVMIVLASLAIHWWELFYQYVI
jgi:hypothetical protein